MSDETVSRDARRWEVPLFEGLSGGGFLTASHLEDVQKQAYEEAREEGYAEGLKAGELELKARIERLDQLLVSLASPYEQMDETVEQQLVSLAIDIAKQLFRRELRVDPSHIVGVVREAIQMLPGSSRKVTVKLHPDDAVLVGQLLAASEGDRAWSIVEDPLIDRGGCKVVTENSQIDAQTEKRFAAVIQAIAGDER